jgi:hypothetical protein
MGRNRERRTDRGRWTETGTCGGQSPSRTEQAARPFHFVPSAHALRT